MSYISSEDEVTQATKGLINVLKHPTTTALFKQSNKAYIGDLRTYADIFNMACTKAKVPELLTAPPSVEITHIQP